VSPLAEVLALVATASLVRLALLGPPQGLEVSPVSVASIERACTPPVAIFHLTQQRIQPIDRVGCAVGPARPPAEWANALAAIRDAVENQTGCILFVEDDVDARRLVALLDEAIGMGFPSLMIALERPCLESTRAWSTPP
jgi:hypothetical protein